MDLSDLFFLKSLISAAMLPPLMPLLIIALGLALLGRKPSLGRWMAWTGVGIAVFLSVPVTMNLLSLPLENVPAIDATALERGQAIVILAGGYVSDLPEYGGPAPNRLTLERVRYGAYLARRSGLPVLVTGGSPEAEAMAWSLAEDFGIGIRWGENQSLDTADNAKYSAKMLKEGGISRIVLVTHAAHMRRSVGEFKAQGLEVIPAPTAGFSSLDGDFDRFFDYVPSATTAYESWIVLHEWLGLLAQRIRWALA